MAFSQTDKKASLMLSDHGTVCLISQAGLSDRLLDLARKKIAKEKIYFKQPIDSWDI
jgi:hypothetical protein